MTSALTLDRIYETLGHPEPVGSTDQLPIGFASLETAEPGHISFLGNTKYRSQLAETRASYVLVPKDFDGEPQDNQCFLPVDDPSYALAKLCRIVEAERDAPPAPGIHATAIVDPSAAVDPSATIGPYCVLEAGSSVGARTHLQAHVVLSSGSSVGADTRLMPFVTLYAGTSVGSRCRIHAGATIGSDGFGYSTHQGRHERDPQIGTVIVEDDCEIGAGTCVDRARLEATILKEGTKLDNMVQVGHNCTIGPHAILCAQVGMAGTTTIESYVVCAGQVGLGGHITLGAGSQVGGQAGVARSLPPQSIVNGSPARPIREHYRQLANLDRIPKLRAEMKAMQERLDKLDPQT